MRISRTAFGALLTWVAIATLPAPSLAAPARAAQPAAMQGVVTQVIDGDSVAFTPAGQAPIVVRLRDIDAPEICQAWGLEAKRALIDLALNKTAMLRLAGRDPRGQQIGVLVVDDVNIGQRMVEEGHAWSLRGRNDTGPLVKQERMAKALGRGLHAGGAAVKPSDFRRTNGPCADAAPAAQPAQRAANPPAVAPAPYRCDGRIYCSQMKSCDEARFFLANCPGVKMDGNHDGIPCERQWCGN